MKKQNNRIEKGFAGRLSELFIDSRLTPVIAIASLLIGLFSVYLTPKEEEPQISVPMIDIMTSAPGFSAEEIERKITEPVERSVWGIEGVEYVYSASSPHFSLITVRFKVGEPVEPALLKIHHKIMEVKNELPRNAQQPQVKSYSIDDVPFMVMTFSSKEKDDFYLRNNIAKLARELSSTPDLSRIELAGGRKKSLRLIADPIRLEAVGVTLSDIAESIRKNDSFSVSGKNWSESSVMDVEIGGRLSGSRDVENIAIGQRAGRIVRLGEVASVRYAPEERAKISFIIDKELGSEKRNAVSLVLAKRKGTNVVQLSDDILERVENFRKTIPKDISMSVVRNYGETAGEKSKELIQHLLIATISVTVLIAIVMGVRAAIVVALAIPVTLALTLAIYYFMGYTLNRVTLFALIFSIGILVDDAIVVVENIERHLKESPDLGIVRATIVAVSEVGNPTILATFTVIAAILPMAFVRGLMGPYMKPIPVGASLAMILSLFVAFIVTPWASVRILKHHKSNEKKGEKESSLDKLYIRFVNELLSSKKSALLFGAFSVLLLLISMSLVYFKLVKVKMLPFDNKNEFQILLDYPVTTPLLKGSDYSIELSEQIMKHKDVSKVQIFAGESAPYSFSGMVKHTFLRKNDYMNDLQVVLNDKHKRKKSSHEIIEELRPLIRDFSKSKNALSKILEIPPGPPVLSTVVAEIYGPDKNSRRKAAEEIYSVFAKEKSVVDLDYSWRTGRNRKIYEYDQYLGGLSGVSAMQAVDTGHLVFSESPLVSLNDISEPEDITIELSLSQKSRSSENPFQGQSLRSFESGLTPLARVLKKPIQAESETLYRKNIKPVNYVMSELSGSEEAPVYGLLKLSPKINLPTQTADVPWNTMAPVVKWDGEWFITYEVFRDLGGAFAVVMILIYILVLGWFRSYAIPLVIMAPIPISLIGIIPGHFLTGAYFTATSMIGFIAGAGIIVRNSIILVDFIEEQSAKGLALKEAVISAGVIRFRPMLLTAAAVVVGSFVMLFDPIFQGLAVSLMFGEVAATIISRFAVPVIYFWVIGNSRESRLGSSGN